MERAAHRWTPGHRTGGPGRWEGTDERLAAALDSAIGSGCCDEAGDVDGPGWYALVPYSHRPGGYVVYADTYGFHSVTRYTTKEEMDAAWAVVENDCADYYDGPDEDPDAAPDEA